MSMCRSHHFSLHTQAWSQKKGGASRSNGHCSEALTNISLDILDNWHARGIGVGPSRSSSLSSPNIPSKETTSTKREQLQREVPPEATDERDNESKGFRHSDTHGLSSASSVVAPVEEKERQPFLLHVHFKETHEPWSFPPSYNASLDAVWEMARKQMSSSSLSSNRQSSPPPSSSLLPPQPERISQLADPTWAFPEAPSMFEALNGQAGPIGGVPAGWPLETLGARIVEFQARGDVSNARLIRGEERKGRGAKK